MPQIHNIRVNNSSYRVEVANTPHLTSLGLSFRTHLSSNGGMLFVFPDEVNRIFHMRNMKIPLDIIFIGADKRVKWIIENAQPDNERLVSLRPSKYVLEVNAGDVKKNSISMHSKLDTLNNPLIKSSDILEGWLQKQDGGGDGGGGFSGTAHTSEGTNTFTRTFGPSKDNKKPWAGKKKKNWAKILTSAPDEEHITVAMLNEWLEKQERDIPSEMRRRGLEPKTGDWEHPYRWVRSIDSSTLSPPEKIQSIIESAPDLKHVLDSLSEVGQPYLVGGCVRDILIGKDCKDFDIEMYGVPQDELGELIQSRFGGSSEQVGKQFGVFKVGDFDISLPRTETQTGEKHTDFDVVPDHTLDPMTAARRRDFTINAMMYDVKEGTILDFFGGEEDLSNGLIKHIDDETFVEDPLRVYRAAQFAARFGFNIDPSTQELASQMDLSKLPIERVNEEFTKMLLKSDTPSIGLDALSEMGVLSRYFPEIAILDETPQRDDYHAEGDVFIHTKMVLDRATDVIKRFPSDKEKITIMLASLCHDLGKPSTTEYHSDGSVSQHGHESAGIDPTRSFLSKLTREVDLINDVEFLVENHLLPPNYFRSKTSDATFRKLINRYGMRRLKLLSAVSEADILGRLNRAEDGGIEEPDNDATEWFNLRLDEVAEKSNLTLEGTIKPLITGHELKDMGFVEGRELGDILRDIKSHQETGQIADSSEATEYVRNKYMSKGLGDLVDWLFKAVSSESIAEAKRKGLVPQSGDWQRPKRWVRPEDADVVEEPDAPRVYSYDEVKKFVEDKVSINFDFDEKQKQQGTWSGSEEYKLTYEQIEDIIEVAVGSINGGEEGPTPKYVYQGFGEPKRDRLNRPVGGREGKRTIPKWQIDSFDGNFQLEWDESPQDDHLAGKFGSEFATGYVSAHCDADNNIVLWRTRNHVTYGQEYPAVRHQVLAENMVHELAHTFFSDTTINVPPWVRAHVRTAYNKAVESEKGFVSKYSTVNSNEFFAECFKTYITKTDLLERTNPEMFELLEILNQADSMESLDRLQYTKEDFDKYSLKTLAEDSDFTNAFYKFENFIGKDTSSWKMERMNLSHGKKEALNHMHSFIRHFIAMGYLKEDLMEVLDGASNSRENANEKLRGMLNDPNTPESTKEMLSEATLMSWEEQHPNARPIFEELVDTVISKYPDYGKVEPWLSMFGRKDINVKKQASPNIFTSMESGDDLVGIIIDPIDAGYSIDEESIREASEFIREQKEKQLSDDESLEKAVSTESIASAKRRGLVPQSGDWQRPRRWVRPEDADVVDEDEASLATQNVYTADDIEKKLEPTIEVKGFPGIGRGRPKTGMSQHEKDRATETLSKGKSVLFKALDGLGKPNPFENGERTLPKWQIDKLNEIDFNWDVVDSESDDGYTGEVLGSVHVGTKKMSLNGLTDRFPKYILGTEYLTVSGFKTYSDLAKEDEDAFMNTIIHEFAHCVATEVTDDIPYWFWSQVEGHYRDALDTHQGIKADLASHEGVDEKFPSDYSRRNVSEFFAECFKTYMTNTELLRDINPEMFELMEILNSTSPDKMEVRPLNEEEIKGDLNLRERPVYVGQGFQKYVRSEILAGAMQKIVKDLEDELAEWKEKHGTYASAKNSSTTMYYLNEIRKEKKELEEWKVVTLTNRRIVIGNIKKAIASGFTKEDIQQGLEQSKRQKSYLEPAPDHFEDFNLWIDEEIEKYPTYGKDYPWTSISPSIVSEFVKIDKQDDDLTEGDYETYVEIYETPTVIRDGEEVSDSITEESVREVGKNIEKATDSKLHRKTEFVIEDTGYEPLAGTWKKVLVGGEPRWINEMGEYKDFSDFKGLDIKKQAPPGAPPRPGLEWKRSTRRWIRPESSSAIQGGISSTIGEGQELTRFFGEKSRKAREYANILINPEGREPTDSELDEAIQIYQGLSNIGGVYLKQALADSGFKDFTVEPNFGLFDSAYEPSLFVSGRISPDRKDDFTRLMVDIADIDFNQRSVIIHEPYDDDENVKFGVSDEATGESIEPAASLKFVKTLTAKEFNELGKKIAEISDGSMGFASHPDGTGIDIINLSVYNTDYEGFLENLGRFLDDEDVERLSGGIERHDGRAKKTRTIGKQSGPAGFYSEGHYEQRDSYDGLITYDDYRSYHGSKKKEEQEFRKQLISNHCSQCDDDCACVTDLDCECPHDCICPDIVALGQDNDNLVSSMVIQKAVTAESVSDARRKGLIPQSGNWMKPRRWIRPVSDVPEKTDEPVTEKSVSPNRQNVDLHNELVSFAEEQGLNYSIESDYVSVDISRAKNIADAYESMEHAPNDPEVKSSYNAMANETKSQWDYLESIGYVMEPWSGDGQPYKDSKEMVNDIIDNKHIYFFTTEGGFGSSDDIEEDHPLLQDSGVEVNDTPLVYNDLFRAVHDVIGHSRGNQFGARGEENAWTEHRQLYSPLARKAMTTETRGQNSWVNFGPHLRNASGNMLKPGDENYISPRDRQFADQKAGLLPEEFLQKMLLKLLKKQVSIFHCSQCSSGCDCVLENHTCECYHDCTCPDNSLSNGSVDIILDVDSLSSFLNLQKAVVSTPMSGEGKFNAKGVETGDSVWITVNDPESPLRGRHILITKRPDGLFALTGGGGQSEDVEARKHIILTGTPKESKRDKELKQTIEEAEEVNSEVIAEKRGLEQEARDRLKSAADSMTEALGIKKTDTKGLLDKKDEVQLHVESVLGEDSSVEAKRITDTIMRQATQANRKISTGVQRERQAILIKVGRKLREVQEAGGEKEVDTSIIPDTIIPQGTTIEEVVESEAINVDVLDEINEALPKFEPVSIPLPDIAEIAEMTPSKQESAIATHFDKEVEKFFGGKDDELDGVAEEDKVPEKPEEEIVTVDLGTAVSEPLKLTSQEQLEEAIEKTRAYFETRKEVQLQSEKIKKVPLNVVTPSTLSDLRDSISAIDVNIDDDELEKLTKDNFDSWTRNNQALAFYDAVGEFWNDDISLTEEISGAGSKIQSTMKFHMDSGAATALAVLAKEHLGLKIDTRILMEKGNIELAASSVAWAIRDKYKADSAKLDETIDSIRTSNASNLEETERKSLIRHSTLSKQMEEIQKQKESGELLDKVKVAELERNNLIEQRINLGVSLGSMQASATLFDQLVKVRTAKDNVLTLNAGEHRRDAETVASNLRLKEGSYDIQPTEEGTWNVILSSDGLDKHISQEKDLQAKHDKYDKIKTDDTGLSEDDDGNVIVEDFDVPFWNDKFVPEGEEDTSQTIDYKWRAEQRNDINWLLATTEKSADNPTGEGGGLITRTVGAGKTNTALGFFAHKMQENSDYKSIVAVPKGRAQQWFDEANRFMTLPEGMNIQLIPEGASKSDVDDILLSSAKGTLFITGHRELSRSHEMLGQIQTNAELGEKIGKFGGICIDEPQELQARGQSGNMGALGRRLMKLPIDHRVGLTATPARRSPLEVYDLIKWSSGATDIGAKTTFQRTFGGFGSGTNAQDTAIRKVFYETIAPYISGDRITQPTFKVNSDTIDITRTDSQIARQKEIESTRDKTISEHQKTLMDEAIENPNHRLRRGANWETTLTRRAKAEARKEVEKQHQENMDGGDWQNNGRLVALREQLEGASDKKHVVYIDSGTQRNALTEMLKDMGYNQNQIKSIASTTYSSGLSGREMSDRVKKFRKGDIPFILIDSKSSSGYNLQNGDQLHVIGTPPEAANYVQAQGRIARMPRKGDVDIKTYRYADSPTEQAHWNDLDAQIKLLRATAPGLFRGQYEEEL